MQMIHNCASNIISHNKVQYKVMLVRKFFAEVFHSVAIKNVKYSSIREC